MLSTRVLPSCLSRKGVQLLGVVVLVPAQPEHESSTCHTVRCAAKTDIRVFSAVDGHAGANHALSHGPHGARGERRVKQRGGSDVLPCRLAALALALRASHLPGKFLQQTQSGKSCCFLAQLREVQGPVAAISSRPELRVSGIKWNVFPVPQPHWGYLKC